MEMAMCEGIVEKRKAMSGWESREGTERCVDGNVVNGEDD